MRSPMTFAFVLCAVAASFFAGALLFRAAPAAAQQAPSSSTAQGAVNSNNRFIAATGGVGSGMSVLWVVDTETKRVLVYGTNSLGKDIELRAARNIEWDTKLEYLNDDSQWKVEDLQNLAEKRAKAAAPPKEKEPAPSGKDGQK